MSLGLAMDGAPDTTGADARRPSAAAAQPQPVSQGADEVLLLLEKLGDLKAKGILTDEEFAAKKAELLKKLS